MGLIDTLLRLVRRPAVLQVAMLCTRTGPDGPEVLLVKTLDTGRWIIPKGWPMAGHTLPEAAAREAWEEAGAVGRVRPQAIGRLSGAKRLKNGIDVPSEIVVFRMDDVELSDDYPEAGKRKRRFLPVAKAAARADMADLSELIRREFA
ncbi:MAG: NUDIX domain-containing protein [Gemmobacter sp.]|nr:NUDIX domain-containing protein [Gemmobacter sp.]